MRIAHCLWAAAIAPYLCWAQSLAGLRATSDGTLFFTSGFQPMGDPVPAAQRIYTISGGVIHEFPNSAHLISYDVSDDGGVVALNRSAVSTITNAVGDEWMQFPSASIRLSGNGAYAAVQMRTGVSLIDIAARQTLWTIDGVTVPHGRVVSGNGIVVALKDSRPVLLREGEAHPVNIELHAAQPDPWPVVSVFLENNGASMAILSESRLYLKSFASPETTALPLPSVNGILSYTPSELVCVRRNDVIRQPLDGRAEVLLSVPEGILSAAASADASRIYTGSESIIRMHSDGEATTLATFHFLSSVAKAAPGVIASWSIPPGMPLIPVFTATPPYPLSAGGYRITIGGIPVPIVSVEHESIGPRLPLSNRIRFLVPWNLPLSGERAAIPIVLQPPQGIPMAGPVAPYLYLVRRNPKFETASPFLRAYQPTGEEIHSANPAAPGAKIRLPMTGLGDVIPLPPNDRPPNVTSSLAAPLECYVSNGIESRRVIPESATLSASTPGVFDVILTLPSLLTAGELYIGCEVEGFGDSGVIPARRAQ